MLYYCFVLCPHSSPCSVFTWSAKIHKAYFYCNLVFVCFKSAIQAYTVFSSLFIASLSSHCQDKGYVTLKCTMQYGCNRLLIRTRCPQIMATFIHRTEGQSYVAPLPTPPHASIQALCIQPTIHCVTSNIPQAVFESLCVIYICTKTYKITFCICLHMLLHLFVNCSALTSSAFELCVDVCAVFHCCGMAGFCLSMSPLLDVKLLFLWAFLSGEQMHRHKLHTVQWVKYLQCELPS